MAPSFWDPGSTAARRAPTTGPQAVALAGVQDNLSGITWCGTTKTLFAVQNGPTQVREVTPDGEVKRTITLSGFDDTEGIAWLGGNKFAIIEERRRKLAVLDIPTDATRVSHDTATTYTIEPQPGNQKLLNKGLEVIAFVPAGNDVYICVEKSPRKIYKLELKEDAKPTEPWDAQQSGFGLSDLAGMSFDAATGNLLLLSDESKVLVEITTDGKELSRLKLGGGSAGLKAPVTQPEGVALGDGDKLYIVGEPNSFYVFEKK